MANMTTGTNGNLSPNQIFYQKDPLDALRANTVYYQMGYKRNLIKSHGQSYTWTLTPIQAAITTAISQAGPVTPSSFTMNQRTTSVQPYGNAYTASSFLDYTSVIDVHKAILEVVKNQGAYSVDTICQNALSSSTTNVSVNLYGANGKTPSTLIAGDVLSLSDIRKATGLLKRNNVLRKNNKYMGVIHSVSSYDLLSSTAAGSLIDITKQADAGIRLLKEGQDVSPEGSMDIVGEFGGMVLAETSLNQTGSVGGLTTYSSYFFGDQSFGVADLEKDNFKVYVKDAGKDSSLYDILEIIATGIGYRFSLGALNLSSDLTTASEQRVFQFQAVSALA